MRVVTLGASSSLHALKAGKVQQSFLPLREVHDQVLCIEAPMAPAKRAYRAVLEISGVNYLLKAEEEQCLINDQFQVFLASLSHAIQILIRVLPLDLSPYLHKLEMQEQENQGQKQQDSSHHDEATANWQRLAQSEITFFHQLAARRTLLERRFYLVIPADQHNAEGQKSGLLSLLWPSKKKTQAMVDQDFTIARQQLDLRTSEIARQLANMGLQVRRLESSELTKLYYSCLTPNRAIHTPLHDQLIEAIDHPIQTSQTDSNIRRHLVSPAPKPQAEHAPHNKQEPVLSKELNPLWTTLPDLLAPSSIAMSADALYIDQEYSRTLLIHAFPRVVSLAWLKPLAELDEPMTMSIHITPRNPAAIIRHLLRKQLEHTTTGQVAASQNKLLDPNVAVAYADISSLIDKLASGEERMLDLAFHIHIHGLSKEELNARTARIQSVLSNMLLVSRHASYEQDKAFRSCLPHARNEMSGTILLNSRSLATMFPFMNHSLFMPTGILEGITPDGSPVVLDWWSPSQRNANRLIIAPSGSGKSYKTKQDMIRLFLLYGNRSQNTHQHKQRYQLLTIDPEREYDRLTRALGGQWIRLAPGSTDHINPFDLPRPHTETQGSLPHGDRLSEKVQQLHALLDIMLSDRGPQGAGSLTSSEKGLLDRALYLTYRKKGITSDVRTHQHPAPLMHDLYDVLVSGEVGRDPTDLTQRLHRFVEGSLAGLFAGQTNVALDAEIVCFDVHDLDTELRPVGYFLISNHVWTASFGSSIPRQLVVDELLSLYQYPEGARFLETLFQRARKHYLGVTGITQHPALLINSTIPSNCAVQILMAQEHASIDLVADMFKLSAREMQILKSSGKGDALLLTNDSRIFIHFEASELGHRLATTDPREIASWHENTHVDYRDHHIVQPLSIHLEKPNTRPAKTRFTTRKHMNQTISHEQQTSPPSKKQTSQKKGSVSETKDTHEAKNM